jgi:sulfate adenylyltransferase subunit 2
MLYSIGKDSSVMLHLAMKAFHPSKPPFPLLHVDTTWKFREMIEFRATTVQRLGLDLIVHVNPEALALGINPFTHGSAVHTDVWKTQGLKQALDKYGFDAAFGGARRDEEKSRAKERIFSFRSAQHRWIRRCSAPNCGASTTHGRTRAKASASFRSPTGPSSTYGNTSIASRSRSFRFISPRSGPSSCATAR